MLFRSYAHRDGYNVLFGDWSAKWYGDPQSRIMWGFFQSAGILDYSAGQDFGLANNCITRYTTRDGTATTHAEASVDVWHTFDVVNGVDVQ